MKNVTDSVGSKFKFDPLVAISMWCFRQRAWVVSTWFLLSAAGAMCAGPVLSQLNAPEFVVSNAESTAVNRILSDQSFSIENILILVDNVDVESPIAREAVVQSEKRLRTMANVADVTTWYQNRSPQLKSVDGRATIIKVNVPLGGRLPTDATVNELQLAAAPITDALPQAKVLVGGKDIMWKELAQQTEADLKRSEMITLPATLIALVVLFGGIMAALMPVIATVATVGVSMLSLYGISHLMSLDSNVPTVVSVMGLGLSIDYGLLYVARFRHESATHLNAYDAAHAAARSATHTVAFSSAVVGASMAAILTVNSPFYRAIAVGGVSAVSVALLANITLTPALISIFSKRVRGRTRGQHVRPARGAILVLARGVARRPMPVFLVVVMLLTVCAAPVIGAQLYHSGPKGLPKSFETRQVYDTIAGRFDGAERTPVVVLSRASSQEMKTYAAALRQRRDVSEVSEPIRLTDDTQVLTLLTRDSGVGEVAQGVVRSVRDDRLRFRTMVGGEAAANVDLKDAIKSSAPLALGLIAIASLVLLFAMSRSVVVPLKALAMSVLSLTASFGVLVLVFQEGYLSRFLGFEKIGSIEPWIPMLVFVLTFALSMDYEIFLISAIKEMRDKGMRNNEAVAEGLNRSGRLVTSAALLMIIVFAGFVTSTGVAVKELGVTMAVAVAIDATLVRCLLVPATMAMLGEGNWWAPRFLRSRGVRSTDASIVEHHDNQRITRHDIRVRRHNVMGHRMATSSRGISSRHS